MELRVATAVGSVVVAQGMGRLLDIMKKDKKEEKDLPNQLHLLARNVYRIEDLRDTVLLDRSDIKSWYIDLKDLMYDAVDLIDSYAIAVETNSLGTWKDYIKNRLFTFTYHAIDKDGSLSLAYEIKSINEKMARLFEEEKNFKLVETLNMLRNPNRETDAVIDPDHPMHGMDYYEEDIMQKLVGAGEDAGNDGLRAVGIVGLGGMGKTTLARFAYEKAKNSGCFELTGWVWVSSEFDRTRLFREILESFGKGSSPGTARADQVAALVKSKKFLLVLDDAWCVKSTEWEELLKPLKHGKQGSRLIVTTRDKKVLQIINEKNGGRMEPETMLTGLDNETLWVIIKEHVLFDKSKSDLLTTDVEDIGKRIVEKTRGSPLAAKAIGRLLGQDISKMHWENIEESNLWDKLQNDENNELPAALVLSFVYLQTAMKSCFTYCSLFPKGHGIRAEELVYQWSAHDYLGKAEKAEESIEELGTRVINHLKGMSLFDDAKYYLRMHLMQWAKGLGEAFMGMLDSELMNMHDGTDITMHDLVHDISLASGRDDHLLIQLSDGGTLENLPENRLRHLHLIFREDTKGLSPGFSEKIRKCEKLRTLILRWRRHEGEAYYSLGQCFHQLKRLRVLSLSGFHMAVLPQEIGELKHLTYLELSHCLIEKLTSTFKKLSNLRILILFNCLNDISRPSDELEFLGQLSKLQCLDLSQNVYLEKLPEAITLLSNLQMMRLTRCFKLNSLPDRIGNLISLERLDLESCNNIRKLPQDLGSLSRLRELNLHDCFKLQKLPNQILGLKKLRRLFPSPSITWRLKSGYWQIPEFEIEVGKGHELNYLKNLDNQQESLDILGLENVHEHEAKLANLEGKTQIKELRLKWSGKERETVTACEQGVLEGLKPNERLEKLIVVNYGGRQPPSWLRGQHLFLLKELTLEGCSFMRAIVSGREIFPRLEFLKLGDLPELQEWASYEKNETAPDDTALFCPLPRLETLEISCCDKRTFLSSVQTGFSRAIARDCPSLAQLQTGLPYLCEPTHMPGMPLSRANHLEIQAFSALHPQTVTSINVLNLINCCHSMSNSFLKNVVAPLLNTTTRECYICSDELEMYISQDEEDTYASFCWDYKEYNINNKALQTREGEDSCSRAELLKCILECLGSSRIKKLVIYETRDLILCTDIMLGQSFHQLINPNTSLSLYQLPRQRWEDTTGRGQNTTGKFFISGCPQLGTLANGIMNNPLPNIRHLAIKNCENLVVPPITGFTKLPDLKTLELENCPKLTLSSLKDGSALPSSLQELVITNCKSFDIDSVNASLSTPSLTCLSLNNFFYRISNIFMKGVFAHSLGTLKNCSINTSGQDFLFLWKQNEGTARIVWDCEVSFQEEPEPIKVTIAENQEIATDDPCTRKDVLEEMLSTLPSKSVKQLLVAGIHEISAIDGSLKQLFLNLTSLSLLQIIYCKNLISLPEDMSTLSSLERLEIGYCENFCPRDEGWAHIDEGKVFLGLCSINIVKLFNCDRLCSAPCVRSLKELQILHCNGLEDLSSLGQQSSQLQKLLISDCSNLIHPPGKGFRPLDSLQIMILKNCPKLSGLSQDMDGCDLPSSLKELEIDNCMDLQQILKCLPPLVSLQKMTIK